VDAIDTVPAADGEADPVGDGTESSTQADDTDGEEAEGESGSSRRRRRRRRRSGDGADANGDDPPNTTVRVREARAGDGDGERSDGIRGIRGSVRLEAKRQRRREGRESNRRRRAPILTEAEFLARRESVDRMMAVRQRGDLTQIAVLEDGVLVEHHVTRASTASSVGNVYLGRVQNVLPGMEAAFVDIGRGRNGVLYAGEVNWDAAGLEGRARSIEAALKSGDAQLVQVTKDPIGHKGARLTSQISLPGRFLVYVPGGGMTGISRKLPDTERTRLKAILKKIVPEGAGVIVRTAAEGASEADLTHDVERLKAEWAAIEKKAAKTSSAPTLLHGEPDLAIRVVRDVFNEDFRSLVVDGDEAWQQINEYVDAVAPDLAERVSRHTGTDELFAELRVDEQLAKALDRKVWLPSGGSLVIDRTEAMTVIDVNTGKFTGSGGDLEATVTKNNLEAAEEIVRQLRLRDLGGIVVIDFIDMVLESNRELVLRRLTECLGRDRTKHQVAEVTSLGLVQMTRKRVGEGLLEAFSEPCEHCHGRGVIVHTDPVARKGGGAESGSGVRAPGKEQPAKKQRKTKVQKAEEARLAAEAAEQRAKASAAMNLIASKLHPHDEAAAAEEVAEAVAATESAEAAAEFALEPVPADQWESAVTGDGPSAGEPAAPPPTRPAASRPRRRRAASRPAGPPQPHAAEPVPVGQPD
jgi:ribonuclease E